MTQNDRVIFVVSWDGASTSLDLIHRDVPAVFETIVFNYSGNGARPPAPLDGSPYLDVLSFKTECKGQIYAHVEHYLREKALTYKYVALFDDDLEVSVSDLNRAITLADKHQLDSFAPTLTADSHASIKRFKSRSGQDLRPMVWVEVMMPFYRQPLFEAGFDYYQTTISSYGIDQFLMPMLQKTLNMPRAAVLDTVVVRHSRPITSDTKVFSNGLTALQERRVLRKKCLDALHKSHPELVGTAWYYQIFAPMNGHGSFWVLYAFAPFQIAARLLRQIKAAGRMV